MTMTMTKERRPPPEAPESKDDHLKKAHDRLRKAVDAEAKRRSRKRPRAPADQGTGADSPKDEPTGEE